MLKAELRKIYLEKRRAVTSDLVAEMSASIRDRFFGSTDLSGIRTLHTFLPIERFREIDTWMIVSKLWRDHPKITTVTSMTGPEPTELAHMTFDSETEYSVSGFGIKEPTGGRRVDPASIDLVLVPLLCIDQRGYRVGYGKGLYDRFLAKCRPDCQKIGLSLFAPIGSVDDVNSHDVALDRCITVEEIVEFAR